MKKKTFFLNGQEYYTENKISIFDLINYFNYNQLFFVLEYNNLVYTKESWTATFLQNKDKIEIITIVGGG